MSEVELKYDESLCIEGKFEELGRIRDYIENKAASFGFTEDDSMRIALAVDEACSNLIKHAYHFNSSQKICIKIESANQQFTVCISDNGEPFNPLDYKEPDMNQYFKELKPGGLGIHIMKKVMDEISYTPSTKRRHKNILKLKKLLQPIHN